MIEVKEVTTKKELEQFVKFPFSLYKKSKNWVPPIIKEELNNFDKDQNPAFKDAIKTIKLLVVFVPLLIGMK